MENKKNELDELLKNAMQFAPGEEPEPAAYTQKALRKKVNGRKVNGGNRFFIAILRYMNTEIKLYHAGIAVAAVAMVFIMLRPATMPTTGIESNAGTQIADTSLAGNSNSLKQDSFLVKNFSTSFY
jgi:hypothetical protein